jgi:multidrug efflux system membrane fusion protein
VVAALGVGYWAGGRSGHAAKPAAADGPEPEDNGPTVTSSRNADPTKPIPVVAGAAERRDMPIYLTGIGTVSAFNTVQVKARVDGQLTDIRFREGQSVKVGEVLATIDQRPYLAVYKQALANVARDQAQLANAKLDLERDINLKEFASRQSVDTQRSMVAQYTAAIGADQAQVDAAKTNLDYTTITSPIDGRTGIRNVDVGNIVHAGDTSQIVTVTQLKPISVVFTLPADDLALVSRGMKSGAALDVLAYAKDNQQLLGRGKLLLVDNQIDSTTGTIRLKANFDNEDGALWPGQFVNAHVLVDTAKDALVVSAQAVQRGPDGTYVWVIGGDGKVQMRPVTVAQVEGAEALLASGLEPGEQVVVDGQYKLQPGSRVEKTAAPPQTGRAPPA